MEIGESHGTRIVWRGIIEEYREFLPVSDDTPIITLNEGNTPLIKSNTAASLAGVIKLYKNGYFRRGSKVVCTLTGNGLKDPDTVFKVSKAPLKVKADVETVERAIEGIL